MTDIGSKTDHAYGEWSLVTSPTYTQTGVEMRNCTYDGCEVFEIRTVSATGQMLVNAVTVVYDKTTGALILLNVPSELNVVVAVYNAGQLVECDLRLNVGGTISFILSDLPDGCVVKLFFLDQSWQAIALPKIVDLA